VTGIGDRSSDRRVFWFGLAGLIVVAVAIEAVFLYGVINDQFAIGLDLPFYKSIAQRWLDTGVYYTDRELAGPFQVQTEVDNLYPPLALYLFVPFLWLPAVLWWIVPLALVAYVLWWCRPAAWALPILALIMLDPKSLSLIFYGNSNMWVAAAVAAGVRWGWPVVLVAFKPSVGFFGVIGVRTRAWWIAAGLLALASAPLAALWIEYPTVLLHSSAGIWYSLPEYPYLFLPVLGWLASTRRGPTPLGAWVVALLSRGDRRADP
jgi:hypothetical protein